MKTIFIFLSIFLGCLFTQAQSDSIVVYRIEYERKITPENFTQSFTACLELKLFTNVNISVFDSCESTSSSGVDIIENPDDDSQFYYTPKGKNIRCVLKDYNNNRMFNKQDVAKKYFTIKDSLNIFDWEIKDQVKDILGYNCQLATMTFRGRDYSAWFSPDLPVGGPWKYDGLPGMILAIKSNEPFIEFEATGIETRKIIAKQIENPFENDKPISWSDYKSLYKKKAIELSNYSPEKGLSGGIIVQRIGIERYIEEDDMDYMADKEFEKQLSDKQN
ncbi:GLPGLI family protein [Flaviramulus basaltis]|uniref:GLPGLI family protein n=1 Tax=Flaviramulus basaltis TaxID=369401 RepID=A0A1K2ID90_9FLAO|nr:GLPGLI family protein [Flaviramulus basaltis]SFZ90389.1 GLPGLI family protein [Flaviramulus basaltis]